MIDLPTELLLDISDNIPKKRDLLNLSFASKRLYAIIRPQIFTNLALTCCDGVFLCNRALRATIGYNEVYMTLHEFEEYLNEGKVIKYVKTMRLLFGIHRLCGCCETVWNAQRIFELLQRRRIYSLEVQILRTVTAEDKTQVKPLLNLLKTMEDTNIWCMIEHERHNRYFKTIKDRDSPHKPDEVELDKRLECVFTSIGPDELPNNNQWDKVVAITPISANTERLIVDAIRVTDAWCITNTPRIECIRTGHNPLEQFNPFQHADNLRTSNCRRIIHGIRKPGLDAVQDLGLEMVVYDFEPKPLTTLSLLNTKTITVENWKFINWTNAFLNTQKVPLPQLTELQIHIQGPVSHAAMIRLANIIIKLMPQLATVVFRFSPSVSVCSRVCELKHTCRLLNVEMCSLRPVKCEHCERDSVELRLSRDAILDRFGIGLRPHL